MSSTKPDIFRFKQFEVDQTGCAMKVNTDGVLLAALAETVNGGRILDIGTGTGLIAMMLAQRFSDTIVDAVEIDPVAAGRAEMNFKASAFSARLNLYPQSFQDYSAQASYQKYNLIVSNPPFFMDSLKNTNKQKEIARHADKDFFKELIRFAAGHLSGGGKFALILPLKTALVCTELAAHLELYPVNRCFIRSFDNSEAHRVLISFSPQRLVATETNFVIYSAQKQYSEQYREVLRPFLTIFK